MKRAPTWTAPFLAVVLLHLALWGWIALARGTTIDALLQHFDGGWYSRLCGQGYALGDPPRWAFYPLYPTLVHLVLRATGWWSWQATVGMALSTTALALALHVAERARQADPTGQARSVLYPATPWGYALLLASPASYVLHSHHTEGLFLLLSLLAFHAAERGRVLPAALWAGLSTLARVQGAFVVFACAVSLARGRATGAALGRAAALLAVAAAIHAPWPAYQAWHTGSPTFSAQAQQYWGRPTSVRQVGDGLLLRLPHQRRDLPTAARHLAFAVLLAAGIATARCHAALGLYVLLSLAVNPLRGDLSHALLRFAAVLFPVWFALGDALARTPRPVRWLVFAAVLTVNLHLAALFGRGVGEVY